MTVNKRKHLMEILFPFSFAFINANSRINLSKHIFTNVSKMRALYLCIFCLIFDSQVEPINPHRLNDSIECVPIYILYSVEFNAE